MDQPIDVEYKVVGQMPRKAPVTNDWSDLFQTLIGLGLLSLACYGVHLLAEKLVIG